MGVLRRGTSRPLSSPSSSRLRPSSSGSRVLRAAKAGAPLRPTTTHKLGNIFSTLPNEQITLSLLTPNHRRVLTDT